MYFRNFEAEDFFLRTSLYADYASIFVGSIKEGIQNLSSIIDGFGEVNSLCTNFHKKAQVRT
jgi:hypothetical protein